MFKILSQCRAYLYPMSEEAIVNRVSSSGLITIDLQEYLPDAAIEVFDLKDFLFMEMILKEKDFREALKQQDWEKWSGKYVAITCTADAIIPVWAYMLVVTYLQQAREVYVGTAEEMRKHLLITNIHALDATSFEGQRVVVKGCGDEAVGNFAYAALTRHLLPHVKTIMYGEPCSTVPVFKKR